MKRFLILFATIALLYAFQASGLCDNTTVTNDAKHPVPVYLANPSPAPSPAIALATAANQTNGKQKTQIDQTTPGTTNGITLYVFNGTTWDAVRGANRSVDLNAITITAPADLWTPASGKKVRIMGGTISVSAACSVYLQQNSNNAFIFRTPKLAADTPYWFVVNGGQGFVLSVANATVAGVASAAATITGTLYGTEE